MFIISVLCILLALSLLLLKWSRGNAVQKLPPGPYPLPIIGNIHKLGTHPHKSLATLAQVYGPIMSLKLGRITTIVISSSTAAQQVLQKQDLAFSSRPWPDAVRAIDHLKFSVLWMPAGSQWRTLRKIMGSNLFTNNRLDANQHLRTSKVRELVKYCDACSRSGEAVDIGRAAFQTSLNLLSNTLFSKNMADMHHNTEGKEFKDLVGNIMTEMGKPNIVDYFPILRFIDPQGIKRRLNVQLEKLLKLLDELVNERLELQRLGNSDNFSTDLLDQLLKLLRTDEIEKLQMIHLLGVS